MKKFCVLLMFLLAACSDDNTATSNNQQDMPSTMMDMNTKDVEEDIHEDVIDLLEIDMSTSDMLTQDMRDMSIGDMSTSNDMTAAVDMADMPTTADMSTQDMTPAGPLYKGAGDVFTDGPLIVEVSTAQAGNIPVTIWSPKQAGRYAVVVFQHGFLLDTSYYSQLITHIASHGYVVVAPQMYTPGGLPFGKPSTAEETTSARQVLAWVKQTLAMTVNVGVSTDDIGLVGHSRGAKVIWGMMNAGEQAKALAGIDPVDGTGGPLGNEPRVVMGNFSFQTPSLIVGTGLGPMSPGPFQPSCAPMGDNHEQFYTASSGTAYHIEVPNYGHLDMLDDQTPGCGLTCTACPSGQSRPPMRKTTAGVIVAFLRGQLQGDAAAFGLLSQGGQAPAPFTSEQK